MFVGSGNYYNMPTESKQAYWNLWFILYFIYLWYCVLWTRSPCVACDCQFISCSRFTAYARSGANKNIFKPATIVHRELIATICVFSLEFTRFRHWYYIIGVSNFVVVVLGTWNRCTIRIDRQLQTKFRKITRKYRKFSRVRWTRENDHVNLLTTD